AFPWPPAGGESVLDAWGRTWSGASLRPRQFFASMPGTASLGPAVLYYLSIGIPVAGVQLFWTMVRGSDGNAADSTAGALGALGEWSPLMGFLFSPAYLLISLVVAAGVTHLLLKLFGGTHGDYGMTTRVFAYAYSPQILGIIPVAGTFAGFVWMVVIAIVGVREAHRTTTGRAAAAILVPVAFALAFVAVAELIATTGRLLDTGL
ncbi:MAG: YIP1 family protein, partial [Longimicrobiales bacterium]